MYESDLIFARINEKGEPVYMDDSMKTAKGSANADPGALPRLTRGERHQRDGGHEPPF